MYGNIVWWKSVVACSGLGPFHDNQYSSSNKMNEATNPTQIFLLLLNMIMVQ